MKRTEIKHMAQDALMHGIANQLGYYDPKHYGVELTEEQTDDLHQEMQKQADRVARLFGFERAWSN